MQPNGTATDTVFVLSEGEAMTATPRNPLLAGVRVLDLSRLLPGPYCALYLAQLGAEVIKIEPPQGDYARRSPELFAQVNRGKRSVVLDFKQASDVETFKRMVDTADVVLESFRPGVMDKLGLGYEALKRINPRLVYAALTGYGQTGPYRGMAGHDINYLALSGVLDQVGPRGGAPAPANVPIADLSGALNCAIGILAALHGVRANGVGSFVDVSLTDSAAALNVMALTALRQHGASPQRGEDIFSGALPQYGVYRCRDGKYLALGALESKFLKALLSGLGQALPGFMRRRLSRTTGAAASEGETLDAMPHPRVLDRKLASLRRLLHWLLRTRPRDAWVALLHGHDACVTPVLTLEEALAHEQLRERGMICGDEDRPVFNLPIFFDNACARQGAAPALGADDAIAAYDAAMPLSKSEV